MGESAFCQECPECNSRNWINQGNLDDFCGQDTEGIRCWKCKHVFLVEGVEELINDGDIDIDNLLIDDGQKVLT